MEGIDVRTVGGAESIVQPAACGKCKHSHAQDKDLYCRRFPPVPHIIPRPNAIGKLDMQNVSVWPVVMKDQSCGEFRPRTAL